MVGNCLQSSKETENIARNVQFLNQLNSTETKHKKKDKLSAFEIKDMVS